MLLSPNCCPPRLHFMTCTSCIRTVYNMLHLTQPTRFTVPLGFRELHPHSGFIAFLCRNHLFASIRLVSVWARLVSSIQATPLFELFTSLFISEHLARYDSLCVLRVRLGVDFGYWWIAGLSPHLVPTLCIFQFGGFKAFARTASNMLSKGIPWWELFAIFMRDKLLDGREAQSLRKESKQNMTSFGPVNEINWDVRATYQQIGQASMQIWS